MQKTASRLLHSITCLMVLTAAAPAIGVGDPAGQLAPDPNAQVNFLGTSIAISGDLILVGSLHDASTPSVASGAALLFDANTGASLGKLPHAIVSDNDWFGWAVALNGRTALVGSPGGGGFGGGGSAYVFDTQAMLETHRLSPTQWSNNDDFGRAVAVHGTTALVGAPPADLKAPGAGAAFLFNTLTGQQTHALVAPDGIANEHFGKAVAIHGDFAVVGSLEDDDDGSASGSVYVYSASTGQLLTKLTASDAHAQQQFGTSLAVNATTLLIGAAGDQSLGAYVGAVYVIELSTLSEVAKLLPIGGQDHGHFGAAVAFDADSIIVGGWSPATASASIGSAYIFEAVSYAQVAKLTPINGQPFDTFGGAVAVRQQKAYICASGAAASGPDSGAVFVFGAPEPATLTASTYELSLGAGGTQQLQLDAGPSRAGWIHFMLGSASGTAPGIDFGGGVVLPLNVDPYFNLHLNNPGLGVFNNFVGVLDNQGQAVASITVPALSFPSLAGITLHHAYAAAPVFGVPHFASNAAPLKLIP